MVSMDIYSLVIEADKVNHRDLSILRHLIATKNILLYKTLIMYSLTSSVLTLLLFSNDSMFLLLVVFNGCN